MEGWGSRPPLTDRKRNAGTNDIGIRVFPALRGALAVRARAGKHGQSHSHILTTWKMERQKVVNCLDNEGFQRSACCDLTLWILT